MWRVRTDIYSCHLNDKWWSFYHFFQRTMLYIGWLVINQSSQGSEFQSLGRKHCIFRSLLSCWWIPELLWALGLGEMMTGFQDKAFITHCLLCTKTFINNLENTKNHQSCAFLFFFSRTSLFCMVALKLWILIISRISIRCS